MTLAQVLADAAWVHRVLPAGDYGAPHGARFLAALADRLGTGVGALDTVLCREADPVSAGPQDPRRG